MRLSQVGGLFSEPLNSNAKGPSPVEGPDSPGDDCPPLSSLPAVFSFVSGVESSVLMPPLKLIDDVNGRLAELRFRSLDVGAEAA